MQNRTIQGIATAAAAGSALALGVWGAAHAQGSLRVGGPEGSAGRVTLSGGFMPDPWTSRLAAGGDVDVRPLGLRPGCRGFVSRQPHYVLEYENARRFLRIYFEGEGDTTLVVHDGAGSWRCDDDSHGGVHPTVDIENPPSGQYDIWVGGPRAGERIPGRLHVTEMRSRHP